jgi:hypothetical protein
MSSEAVAAQLIEIRRANSTDVYDEVFLEVADRVKETGSVGKADVGALLFWKRLRADTRWARALHAMRDSEVRSVTGQMVLAAHDVERSTPEAASVARRALSSLPGFGQGDALASAVIAAAHPDRMAVYDRRAHSALLQLGHSLDDRSGRYGRYMAVVEELLTDIRVQEPEWTARDVDLALFWIGGRA